MRYSQHIREGIVMEENCEYYYFEFFDEDLISLLSTGLLCDHELELIQFRLIEIHLLERLFRKCVENFTDHERNYLEAEGIIDCAKWGFPWAIRLIFDKEKHFKIVSHCLLAQIGTNLTNENTSFTTKGTLDKMDVDLTQSKQESQMWIDFFRNRQKLKSKQGFCYDYFDI
jgi:hypothetical protein